MDDDSDNAWAVGPLDEFGDEAKRLLGLADAPAYLRRALRVQDALDRLRAKCEQQRDEWLAWVHRSRRMWAVLVHADRSLPGRLSASCSQFLDVLDQLTAPPDISLAPWIKPSAPAMVWSELSAGVKRFNQRWAKYLETLNPDAVNQLIDGYNRYYVFEKECAFRSTLVAARGFAALPRVTAAWLLAQYPLLPAPPRLAFG